MNILVTGGAGFIGSHLSEALLGDGHRVTILDDLSTGNYANVSALENNPDFKAVIGSIEDLDLVDRLAAACDRIFHLAAAVGVQLICEHPIRGIEINILGTTVVLQAAARHRKKILITSSSEVYGSSDRDIFNEDDDIVISPPPRLRCAYAASKAVDEFLALAYRHEQQLPVVVARLFNTVGPRQTGRYGMVIPRFIDQALKGLPLTVYGDGSQRRSFTAVADSVEALVRLMECPAAVGEVVNVGSHNEVSINKLAEMIIRKTGSLSIIKRIPFEEVFGPRFQDMERRYPDIEKLRRLTGFVPARTLEDVLDLTIAEFRKK
jgi:UDP-glucose 4-epimerase